jgi:hypothetical protein
MNKKIFVMFLVLGIGITATRADKPVYTKGNFNGHGYELVADPAPWHVAKKKADKNDGYLVVITTPEENEYVMELIKKSTKGEFADVWLGLTDEKKEGEWRWVNGEKMTFNKWQPNQPDNAGYWAGSENCVHLQHSQAGFGWNDYSGDGRFVYIIEYDHEIDCDGVGKTSGIKSTLRSTR